jgi:hypothetical protein
MLYDGDGINLPNIVHWDITEEIPIDWYQIETPSNLAGQTL